MKLDHRLKYLSVKVGNQTFQIPRPKTSLVYSVLKAQKEPIPYGGVTEISRETGVDYITTQEALRLKRLFDENPALRKKWEPSILAGQLSAKLILARIAEEKSA